HVGLRVKLREVGLRKKASKFHAIADTQLRPEILHFLPQRPLPRDDKLRERMILVKTRKCPNRGSQSFLRHQSGCLNKTPRAIRRHRPLREWKIFERDTRSIQPQFMGCAAPSFEGRKQGLRTRKT